MAPKKPPVGLLGFLMVLGPSLVWCGEYIGSGEVILATRSGAIFGPAILWAVVFIIFFKYWIGLCGARYTVVTGEAMIDAFARLPGPRNWAVWVTLIAQVTAAVCSIGALANMASIFLHSLLPLGLHSRMIWASVVTAFAIWIAWMQRFDALKWAMGLFVGVIVLGVAYVAVHALPSFRDLLIGLFGFRTPDVPDWARAADPSVTSVWGEILPMMGWAAGGFASQVWYTYWVMGAGYGMTAGRSWGMRADEEKLARLSAQEAREIRPWLRAVAFDATTALLIGVTVTAAFLLAGAGVLRPEHLVPKKEQVATELSLIFTKHWDAFGGYLFLAAGAAAMISTQLGQLAGWPRLLADCIRNIKPSFGRINPARQFRLFLCLFLITNLVICGLFGAEPILLVKLGSLLDGLLLVPLQALAVAYAIFFTQRKLLSPEAGAILRPRWYHLAGLIVAAVIFAYLCIFQVPAVLQQVVTEMRK